ncbi:hypothetical protein K439DRAFT_1624983 [Ramaria rubella]|nr:hypothetical protein K439DRAFT_1624983 [Ramaria rubella]
MLEGSNHDKGCDKDHSQSRDGIDPSKIIVGPRQRVPSVCMSAALEATKIGTRVTKISKTTIGIPLPKAALSGKLVIRTKPATVSKPPIAARKTIAVGKAKVATKVKPAAKTTSKLKTQVAVAPLRQVPLGVPGQLSNVPEGDESTEDSASANKAGNIILDSDLVEFAIPSGAMVVADNDQCHYDDHNLGMSEWFWAGADDDQESDYDEVENPENEEMEDEEDQDESDEEEEDEVPKPIKPKWKIKTTTVASPIVGDPVHLKVISTLQGVIGSLKLPASKRPPLVVNLNKSGTPWLLLNTAQDWEQLKSD